MEEFREEFNNDYSKISELFLKYKNEDISNRKLDKNERRTIMKELYSFYEISYKKNSWDNYILWLKSNRLKHNPENIEKFKKINYKKITPSSFASFWLGFIPTKDLYYILSEAKDRHRRGMNFNKWLFWAISKEK